MSTRDPLLNVTEVADLLGVAVSTAYQWAYERRIRTVKLGRTLRFRKSDVEAYIRRCERPALRDTRGGD